MRTIPLAQTQMERTVAEAAKVLRSGGVILFPTDTLYGLGADAFSDEAVGRIYAIKGRDEHKPIHCIVADLAMAELYAEVSLDARLLIERLMPGGLTLIVKKRHHVRGGIARGMHTIGIRIPDNAFCLTLARAFNRPFTATSANRSTLPVERSVDLILRQLGEAGRGIDLAVDAGELPLSPASTVVDLSREAPVILREGAVSAVEVWNTIKEGE